MYYGKITRHQGQWRVTARADVGIRLRRLFGRSEDAARGHGPITIEATPEIAYELVWIMERWPLDIGAKERAVLLADAAVYERQRDRVATILDGVVPARPSYGLALEPRPYQRQAVELALAARGLIVGDDLGLGKTITALAALAADKAFPAVVVTLTHLPRQWEREVHRALPEATVHIARRMEPPMQGGRLAIPASQCTRGDGRLAVVRGGLPDVTIMPYSKLRGWGPQARGCFKGVVFDEGQELRRAEDGGIATQKYSGARSLIKGASLRMILTATPVYNYGAEVYNLCEIVSPGQLGTNAEFKRQWCSGDKGQVIDPVALGEHLRGLGLLLRRTRADVGRELPAVTRVVQEIPCDMDSLHEAGDMAAKLASIILGRAGEARERGMAGIQLDGLIRQATGVGKAGYVAEFVRAVLESEPRVLLLGWHRAVYEIWGKMLAPFKPVLLTGSESPAQKHQSVEAFTRGDSRVLIMSLRSGVGIEGLQRVCSVGIFGELDWSPKVHEQIEGRLNREELMAPALFYYLTSGEGSDPVMLDVLGVKEGQSHGIRDLGAEMSVGREVDPERLRQLAERFVRRAHAV